MTARFKREPTQARSHRRRERILQAAAELLNDLDYAVINVGAIAERAETSVGSIYQFFPNKDAVLRALAESYLEDMRDTMAAGFRFNGESIESDVALAIDWLTDYADAHPGFLTVLKSDWVSPDLKEAVAALHAAKASAIERVMGWIAPRLRADKRALHAQVVLGIVDGILPLVLGSQGDTRALLIAEMKRAVACYAKSVVS